MDREDLMNARRVLPDLDARWQERRHRMHRRLEDAWSKLNEQNGGSQTKARRNTRTLYKDIVRTDRVISFLDRALVHLDDIEHGTHHVDGMPIEPASSHANAERQE